MREFILKLEYSKIDERTVTLVREEDLIADQLKDIKAVKNARKLRVNQDKDMFKEKMLFEMKIAKEWRRSENKKHDWIKSRDKVIILTSQIISLNNNVLLLILFSRDIFYLNDYIWMTWSIKISIIWVLNQ